MQRSKAESYIGFCIRAGKLTCGFNAVATLHKDVYLLLLCGTASENAVKQALSLRGINVLPAWNFEDGEVGVYDSDSDRYYLTPWRNLFPETKGE